ncbi:5-oxoprolinase subunit B family protein [Microlunatus endophyticus]|nr:allophanate hydrolase subunit 1 [Microlunatus endophyticus]
MPHDQVVTRRLLPYGESARLLECQDLDDSQRMAQWLSVQRRPEIAGVVPGARTLLLRLTAPLPAELARTMITIEPEPLRARAAEAVTIDVRYDGADLAEVADGLGLSTEELITHHTGQQWVVAFCGFAPGFGYLAPTGPELRVPRRSTPRTRVPAGAVAIADNWSAIYPTASPGGWQLIGSTDVRLFDVTADPPALLSPGTRVQFRRLTP